MSAYKVGCVHPTSCVDVLEFEPSGLVRVLGWSIGAEPLLELLVNGAPLDPVAGYRTYRPDVADRLGAAHAFRGFGRDWLARPPNGEFLEIELRVEGKSALRVAPRVRVQVPAYDGLFTTPAVLGRGDIYSFGPPTDDVAETFSR